MLSHYTRTNFRNLGANWEEHITEQATDEFDF